MKLNIAVTNNVFPYGKKSAYGGERIVGYLVEALVNKGHNVYAFARIGTEPCEGVKGFYPINAYEGTDDPYYHAVKNLVDTSGIELDVYHCWYFGDKFNSGAITIAKAFVETVWNRWCHRPPFFSKEQAAPNIVSYSKVLQQDLLDSGVKSTMIHYGLPKDLYEYSPDHDDYAVWIGKIEGGKRPDLAIQLALAANMKIVLMGPPYNTTHFWQQVAPWLNNPNVYWVRGVDDRMKNKIMRKAKVFISSNDNTWKEHAGIVNMESLACGTPIIAFNRINQECAIWTDSIIEDGKHGFFLNYNDSNDIDEILSKGLPILNRINEINRQECRKQFENRFTSELMAKRYEFLYNHIINVGDVDSLTIPF